MSGTAAVNRPDYPPERQGQYPLDRRPVVIFAEPGCQVNDPGPFVGDESPAVHETRSTAGKYGNSGV